MYCPRENHSRGLHYRITRNRFEYRKFNRLSYCSRRALDNSLRSKSTARQIESLRLKELYSTITYLLARLRFIALLIKNTMRTAMIMMRKKQQGIYYCDIIIVVTIARPIVRNPHDFDPPQIHNINIYELTTSLRPHGDDYCKHDKIGDARTILFRYFLSQHTLLRKVQLITPLQIFM